MIDTCVRPIRTQYPGGQGCRRSSSDAAYEPAETVKAQRECRLRPHYSDPMPADAAKRKQLEMKIAVAARLHSQRRDRDGERERYRDSGELGGGDAGDRVMSLPVVFAHAPCSEPLGSVSFGSVTLGSMSFGSITLGSV